jgi:hypothetical protein
MDKPDLDVSGRFPASGSVALSEGDRLSFARQVLLGLAVICTGVFVAYGLAPDNPGIGHIFELVKIGALPLVTLVISFYFPSSTK